MPDTVPLTEAVRTLTYWLIWAIDIALALLFGGVIYALWPYRHMLQGTRQEVGLALSVLGWKGKVILFGGIPMAALFRLLQISLPHASSPVARVWLGTGVVLTLSGLLFQLKITHLRSYAILEGLFALSVCVRTLAGMEDTIAPGQVFAILTSVYLFVRAADNYKKDWDTRRANNMGILAKQVAPYLPEALRFISEAEQIVARVAPSETDPTPPPSPRQSFL